MDHRRACRSTDAMGTALITNAEATPPSCPPRPQASAGLKGHGADSEPALLVVRSAGTPSGADRGGFGSSVFARGHARSRSCCLGGTGASDRAC
jgi:hypothetical protein